jgi:hypothetical protein
MKEPAANRLRHPMSRFQLVCGWLCLLIVEQKFSLPHAWKDELVRNHGLARIIETILRSGRAIDLLCIFRRALIAPNLKPSGGALKPGFKVRTKLLLEAYVF